MATATLNTQMQSFTINIPKVDIKRFKGVAKAMGWTFEKEDKFDETDYIMSDPVVMAAIKEGDAVIKSGNFETVNLDDLWK